MEMKLSGNLEYRYTGSGQEIFCSRDAISGIGGVLDRLGATMAMVVCGPSILSKSDVVQRVREALGGKDAGLFSGIAPHSPGMDLPPAVLFPDGRKTKPGNVLEGIPAPIPRVC